MGNSCVAEHAKARAPEARMVFGWDQVSRVEFCTLCLCSCFLFGCLVLVVWPCTVTAMHYVSIRVQFCLWCTLSCENVAIALIR